MACIRRFEDLDCWREARVLVGLVYRLTKRGDFALDYELVRQIHRSALSSMANVAEGFHRNSRRDFLRFLDYARASIAETLSHAYVAEDQGYVGPQDVRQLHRQADTAWKKINGLIAYLRKADAQDNGLATDPS
jgi:four helix bundle protein